MRTASPRSSTAAMRRGFAVEPFPETLVEIDGTEGTLRLTQGYRLTRLRQERHRRARRFPSPAAVGIAALAQHPGKRQRHPAALGRLPRGRPGTVDIRRRQSEDLRAGRGGLSECGERQAGQSRGLAGMNDAFLLTGTHELEAEADPARRRGAERRPCRRQSPHHPLRRRRGAPRHLLHRARPRLGNL